MDQIKKFFWGLFQILSRFFGETEFHKDVAWLNMEANQNPSGRLSTDYYRGLYREFFAKISWQIFLKMENETFIKIATEQSPK